jgi:hypothetical protein
MITTNAGLDSNPIFPAKEQIAKAMVYRIHPREPEAEVTQI